MAPRIQVIVPNWNGLQHVQACLHALSLQTFTDSETTVVDNGSTDGSCEYVRVNHPSVRLLCLESNLGFASAVNLGIRESRSEYVATLNNDAAPEPAWLEALVRALDADPGLGMCASKMLFHDRPGLINSAGICVDRAGIAWDRRGGVPDGADDSQAEIFGPCAGAALYRRSMLDAIGLFDEHYFAYLEDVDLAWRAQACGWRCMYVPSARVYHVHSATGVEGSPLKNYLLGRNKWYTILKNYPGAYWPRYAAVVLAYDVMAAAWGAASRRDVRVVSGRLAAWGALQRLRQQRRAIQANPGYSPRAAFDCLDALSSPFAVRRRYQHLQPRMHAP